MVPLDAQEAVLALLEERERQTVRERELVQEVEAQAAAQERVDRLTALAGYTSGAAWAGFAETRFGRIAPGQRADFILVDTEPMTASPDAIRRTKVFQTWVGGGKTWDAEAPVADGKEPTKKP